MKPFVKMLSKKKNLLYGGGKWEGGVCISTSVKASETPKAMTLKVHLEDTYGIDRFQGPTSSNYNFAHTFINIDKKQAAK